MEGVPLGYRDPKHEELYKNAVHDPRIRKDEPTVGVEGYFRIPPIWIGDLPDTISVARFNREVKHKISIAKVLKCGIEVHALHDGHFLFDFSSWPLAPQIIIPGFTKPIDDGACRVPDFHMEARTKAEEYSVIRAQVLNAHQACLTTAEAHIKQRATAMGSPNTASKALKMPSLNTPLLYYENQTDMHSIARNVTNNGAQQEYDQTLRRRAIEVEVVEYSFELLDQILSESDRHLLNLAESYFIAACRNRDMRFGEAITLGWCICEQLLSIQWKMVLKNKRENAPQQVTKERLKKLTGRDFSASTITETLELMGHIDYELFRFLNIVRQARNRWAHELIPPKEIHVNICMIAIQRLFARIKNINFHIQTGAGSGVATIPK